MNKPFSPAGVSNLRQRLVEDMTLRGFGEKTQRDYVRIVSRFAAFLGRSPDRATAEDIRRRQIEQREAGMPAPAMNSHVAGLRFFFTTTMDRPDLSRKLLRAPYPPQAANGAQPRGGRPAAGRDNLPQAPRRARRGLWRRAAGCRSGGAQGGRHPRI